MTGYFIRFSIAALACALSVGAAADELRLRNGDRLSGRLLSKSGELLSFETPYAGRLKIKWAEVASLRTDATVRVMLSGTALPLTTRLAPSGDRRVQLVLTGADEPLSAIRYINPRPQESGIGSVYSGHVNASAASARGNNATNRLYADAGFTALAKRYRYSFSGKVNRASEAGVTSASSWLGGGNYDRFLDAHRFWYLRGSLESDRFKDIRRRRTLGAGYGADLVKSKRAEITLRGGVDQVRVDRLLAADESYPALGWGVHAGYRFATGGLELFHDHDGYWNLEHGEDVTIRSRTGLRVPLFDRLSASLQLNLDWDRSPAPGRKAVDSTLLLGANYSW